MIRNIGDLAGWDPYLPPPALTLVGGAVVAGHVQLDVVVDELSRNFSPNSPERPIDGSRLELAHGSALDADRVVMAMTNTREAVYASSVCHEKPADHSRLEKELDGPIYSCSAHRRQLLTERLDREAFVLLLQETGYRLPGSSCPIATVLQDLHEVWVWSLNPSPEIFSHLSLVIRPINYVVPIATADERQ